MPNILESVLEGAFLYLGVFPLLALFNLIKKIAFVIFPVDFDGLEYLGQPLVVFSHTWEKSEIFWSISDDPHLRITLPFKTHSSPNESSFFHLPVDVQRFALVPMPSSTFILSLH